MFESVIQFWFEELTPQQWFAKDLELDKQIAKRFGSLHEQVAAGECFTWRDAPLGSLAEVIVLDQFSRNIFRDTAQSFAFDGMALSLAQFAISKGQDKTLEDTQRVFLYMPYMHSESQTIHQHALTLFEELGIENNLEYEKKHKVIIDQFGRYPHRNAILGRQSTPEEVAFLQQPGSGF